MKLHVEIWPHYEEGLGPEKDPAIFEGVNGFWQNVAIFGCSFWSNYMQLVVFASWLATSHSSEIIFFFFLIVNNRIGFFSDCILHLSIIFQPRLFSKLFLFVKQHLITTFNYT